MRNWNRFVLAATAAATLWLGSSANAGVLNVNHQGDQGAPGNINGPSGIDNTPASEWTDVGAAAGSTVVNGVEVSWAGGGQWGTGQDGPGNIYHGYLDDVNTTASFTIGGAGGHLTGVFDIVVYVGADATGRVGQVSISDGSSGPFYYQTDTTQYGSFIQSTATVDSGAGTPVGNYVVFTGVVFDGSTAITVTGSPGSTNSNQGIAGIQVIPEPATIALIGLGSLLMLRRRRPA